MKEEINKFLKYPESHEEQLSKYAEMIALIRRVKEFFLAIGPKNKEQQRVFYLLIKEIRDLRIILSDFFGR